MNTIDQCPCGRDKTYAKCCGVFISHQKNPSTPEELMRSRYTAYTQANIDYIIETMKSPAADNFNVMNAREWAKKSRWLGLEVLKSSHDFKKGLVEFIAHYDLEGRKNRLHEVSEFIFENGRWFYVNGTEGKVGRNDLCPCGSQKKYKKCCLKITG